MVQMRRSLITLMLLGAMGTACGRATVPTSLAHDLADQADKIAVSLRAGDGCDAAARSTSLRKDVDQAIARGDIPGELAGPVVERVSAIGSIRCVRPTPTPTVERSGKSEESEESEDKGRGKGKKKNDGDDD